MRETARVAPALTFSHTGICFEIISVKHSLIVDISHSHLAGCCRALNGVHIHANSRFLLLVWHDRCTLIVLAERKEVGGAATYDNSLGVTLVTAANRRNPPQCVDSAIHHNNLLNNILVGERRLSRDLRHRRLPSPTGVSFVLSEACESSKPLRHPAAMAGSSHERNLALKVELVRHARRLPASKLLLNVRACLSVVPVSSSCVCLRNQYQPKIQANVSGAADAVMLDVEGFVSETNATNIFVVKGGMLLTAAAGSCLPGITRYSVCGYNSTGPGRLKPLYLPTYLYPSIFLTLSPWPILLT